MIFKKKETVEATKDTSKKSKHKGIKKVLIMCHTGMGSSMILKIKATEVAKENHLPLDISYAAFNEGAIPADIDIIITMKDLLDKFEGAKAHVIGVTDIMDKDYLKTELEKYFQQ